VPGVPWHPLLLGDQLTLSQPREADYAHHITTGTLGFSDLPTALTYVISNLFLKYKITLLVGTEIGGSSLLLAFT
jgi:hypothetical protein